MESNPAGEPDFRVLQVTTMMMTRGLGALFFWLVAACAALPSTAMAATVMITGADTGRFLRYDGVTEPW